MTAGNPAICDAYFSTREVVEPEAREQDLLGRLPGLVARAMQAPGWRRHLDGIDPSGVTNRPALAHLPILRKADLMRLQAEAPPLGGLACAPVSSFKRLFLSPGPVAEPEGHGPDWWGTARGLYAAGVRRSDIAINCFSHHLTPGARLVESGMHAIGATIIAGGVGNADQQVEGICRYGATCYLGTPDFLKLLLDRAADLGKSMRTLTKGFVSGAALPFALRAELSARGVSVLQGYASADLGLIAYETVPEDGLVLNEDRIVEIVDPVTGAPVEAGAVGEVVVTRFDANYPMIRLSTGDLSAIKPGLSPCGRTNQRLAGWLGRADESAKVKGMFVHPTQVAELARRFPEIANLRLVVLRAQDQDALRLEAECATADAGMEQAIAQALRDVTKLGGEVLLTPPGTLTPNSRRIIDTR
ncbi:AMP-binding protein [Xanthobacter sp. V3C-3]|uniref:phenylacetate--CoA ligase family protein n=1 Tax=Xanthobacter lutulentifluminis TaxID=3119935 RepID=UPI00372BF132